MCVKARVIYCGFLWAWSFWLCILRLKSRGVDGADMEDRRILRAVKAPAAILGLAEKQGVNESLSEKEDIVII